VQFEPLIDHPVYWRVFTRDEVRKDVLIRVRKMMHSRKINRIRDNREARGLDGPPKKKQARALPKTYMDMVRALCACFLAVWVPPPQPPAHTRPPGPPPPPPPPPIVREFLGAHATRLV
jgi:hypothetical protein